MPCCSEYNERKSSNWIENGKRKYLNLYIDELPDVQYLFCDVRVSGDSIKCDFSLSNLNGIDADLFRKSETTLTLLTSAAGIRIEAINWSQSYPLTFSCVSHLH